MRQRPAITEKQYDKWAEQLAQWVGESVSPFHNDTPAKKKRRIARAKRDKLYFLKTYLPHYFDKPFADCHKEWADFTDIEDEPVFLAAPREHGKSTFFTVGISLRDICYSLSKFIVIFSDTNDQATEFTVPIRTELEENPRIKSDFGDLKGKKWEQGDFTTSNKIRVLARGRKDKIRSKKSGKHRPDRVWIDDLENDENVLNPRLVKKSILWIKSAILGALAHGYKAMMIGNLFSANSALSQLIDEKDEDDEEGKPLYKSKIYRAIKEDGTPLFPGLWPIKRLLKAKKMMGLFAFNKEMMNLTDDPDAEIKKEWLRTYKRQDIGRDIDDFDIITFVDLSSTSNSTSDPKALVTIGKKESIYVLYAWIKRKPIRDLINKMYEIHAIYGGVIGIEENTYKEFLKELLVSEAVKRNKHLPIKLVHHSSNKILRITTTLSWHLSIGNIFFDFASSDQEILKEQILFLDNPSVHDDGPDALEGAISLSNTGSKTEFKSSRKKRSSFIGRRYVG